MKYYLINIIVCIVLGSCANSNLKKIPVSSDVEIITDGTFNLTEWKPSKTIDIGQSNVLYIIQNTDFLFLGIKNNETTGRYVDLYIENDSIGTINLHASMQLGERHLKGLWNDTIPTFNWGNVKNWTSNSVKVISENEQLSFLESIEPYQGFEFKIAKKKLKSNTSKIRIEIRDFMGKENDIIFPSNSERLNKKNWFQLELD